MVRDGKALPDPAGSGSDSGYPEPPPINLIDTGHRNAHPAPNPRIWDCPEKADQIEIGCSGDAFEHKDETILPTSTHADSKDKRSCDGL